jgi:hypothetical protein
MLAAARSTTTTSAQTEFWFEYLWVDQEYRCAVKRLVLFCGRFPREQSSA